MKFLHQQTSHSSTMTFKNHKPYLSALNALTNVSTPYNNLITHTIKSNLLARSHPQQTPAHLIQIQWSVSRASKVAMRKASVAKHSEKPKLRHKSSRAMFHQFFRDVIYISVVLLNIIAGNVRIVVVRGLAGVVCNLDHMFYGLFFGFSFACV